MPEYSYRRYLRAKKTVDDRAINARVWDRLAERLAGLKSPRILEAGAGIGTMIERLLDQRLVSTGIYTAVDKDLESIDEARSAIPAWAAGRGLPLVETGTGEITLRDSALDVSIRLVAEDVFSYLGRARVPCWDVLVAHAFLDLVDIWDGLPLLLGALEAGGLFYFSINFDGLTVFEPVVDRDLDDQILSLYHESMDTRVISGRPSGSSRTGRTLFSALRALGARILEAGSSDWIVFAGPSGYPDDEAYFLHFLIRTIEQQLTGHPTLDRQQLDRWVSTRHRQIEGGDLVYLAHQVDILGTVP